MALKQENFDLRDEVGHLRILRKMHDAEMQRKNTQLHELLSQKPPPTTTTAAETHTKLKRQLRLVRAEMQQKETAWAETQARLDKTLKQKKEELQKAKSAQRKEEELAAENAQLKRQLKRVGV